MVDPEKLIDLERKTVSPRVFADPEVQRLKHDSKTAKEKGDSMMPAYLLGQVTIHDRAEYEKYLASVMETLAPFDGRPLGGLRGD
jgi:hypothetical protein